MSRLVNVFRSQIDDDLDEELRSHVEEQANALEADGWSSDAARREAHRRLGNALTLRERSRDVKVAGWLDAFLRDLRFGLRMLRKDRVVTLAAILSLGLAMGGCLAAFALIDALILRPLPIRDPGSLIYLTYPQPEGDEQSSFTYPYFETARDAARGRVSFFGVAHAAERRVTFSGTASQEEKVHLQYISGIALTELGVFPAAGRLLSPADDDKVGAHPVAVLSHGFWMRRFGGSPDVVGHWFTYEHTAYRIVGVANEGFSGVEPGNRTDVWVPMTMYAAQALTSNGWAWFQILGRLAPGVTAAEVRDRLAPSYQQFLRDRAAAMPADAPRAFLDGFLRGSLKVRSAANGPSYLRKDFEQPLWILAAVVALVLLIACSNVANLLTARAAAREREMALRISIGAGRARLVQQLLIESGLMAMAACAVGVVVAAISAPAIVGLLAPPEEPVFLDLSIDGSDPGVYRRADDARRPLLRPGASASRFYGIADDRPEGSRHSYEQPRRRSPAACCSAGCVQPGRAFRGRPAAHLLQPPHAGRHGLLAVQHCLADDGIRGLAGCSEGAAVCPRAAGPGAWPSRRGGRVPLSMAFLQGLGLDDWCPVRGASCRFARSARAGGLARVPENDGYSADRRARLRDRRCRSRASDRRPRQRGVRACLPERPAGHRPAIQPRRGA